MIQDPEVPDKLWKVVLTNISHIEMICNKGYETWRLRDQVGMAGCLQFRFEA